MEKVALMGVEKKTGVELELTIFQVFQAETKPNTGLQPTAYRCDVKVASMEWPLWPG
jgi:hypothetical protein